MAYVVIESEEVVGVFASPQAEPQPEGYAEIADDDPRIAAFWEKRHASTP